MLENRKDPRYKALARAWISGVPESEGILKNISVTGCHIEYTAATNILPDTQYMMEIIPEKTSKIGTFELQVECKWMRNDGYSTDVGFIIVASPKGRQFQYYVDYLAQHNAQS